MKILTLNETMVTNGGSEFAVFFGMVSGSFLMFKYLNHDASKKITMLSTKIALKL